MVPTENAPAHLRREQVNAVIGVAVGGAVGATARYGAHRLWPTGHDAFPWTGLWINVLGCLFMGILMVVLKERFAGAPKLLGLSSGTGLLGGFTSFSSYTDDVRRMFESGSPGYAVGVLLVTVAAALAAVTLGAAGTHAVLGLGRARGTGAGPAGPAGPAGGAG